MVAGCYLECYLVLPGLLFWDMWAQLEEYVTDRDRLWIIVMRVKRGSRDTCKPGGFYKDLCNFDGAIKLLQVRDQIDWNAIHAIKVSIEDYEAALPMARQNLEHPNIRLPSFLQQMDEHAANVERIAVANGLETRRELDADRSEVGTLETAFDEGALDSEEDDEDLL